MKYLLLLIPLLIFSSCNLSRQIKETGYSNISFGSGGGFTNEVKTYTLLPDGNIWLSNSLTGDSTFVKKIKLKDVKSLLDEITQSGMDTVKFQHPGNIYSFLEINKQSTTNKISWDPNNSEVPKEIIKVYNNFINSTK